MKRSGSHLWNKCNSLVTLIFKKSTAKRGFAPFKESKCLKTTL